MRKLISTILALCMVLCLLPVTGGGRRQLAGEQVGREFG